MGKLNGKIALITGAARGQGAAEARLFAEEGATVILTDVEDYAGTAIANETGDAATYAHLDVGSESAWQCLAKDIEAQHGHLDIFTFRRAPVKEGFAKIRFAFFQSNSTELCK